LVKIKKYPSITIITPSYNQGKFINRTIESVLSQGLKELEYIIIDGGSNDNTVNILKSYGNKISFISEPDNGQAHAVNKGLYKAKREIIGWLNSDDIYYPDSLRKVLDIFHSNSEIGIIYGMADHIDINDKIIDAYPTEEWDFDNLKNICYICQPAVFFRKSMVEKVGMLDERLKFCMDYEFWLRIGKHTKFHFLKNKLAGSRLYPENKTLNMRKNVHLEIINMLKDKFQKVSDRWLLGTSWVLTEEKKFIKKKFSGRVFYFFTILGYNLKLFWKYNRKICPLYIFIGCFKTLKHPRIYEQLF
jgi:glycosyltransferase involved in cell wall biosynthesis